MDVAVQSPFTPEIALWPDASGVQVCLVTLETFLEHLTKRRGKMPRMSDYPRESAIRLATIPWSYFPGRRHKVDVSKEWTYEHESHLGILTNRYCEVAFFYFSLAEERQWQLKEAPPPAKQADEDPSKKLKRDADRIEKAGRYDQAIALYKQIVERNPRDWNTINKIGDLYARLDRNREASNEYAKVAAFYAKDGFLLKAIAIWKKINKLDSSALEPYLTLADLYAKQGLMMEAKGHYQIVVDEYIKRGQMRDAGDLLKRVVEIDGSDLKVRSKLADLYAKQGFTEEAKSLCQILADELTRRGLDAEALEVVAYSRKLEGGAGEAGIMAALIAKIKEPDSDARFDLEKFLREAVPGDRLDSDKFRLREAKEQGEEERAI
jgi:tetratricopeptide (TPR) repeat protein